MFIFQRVQEIKFLYFFKILKNFVSKMKMKSHCNLFGTDMKICLELIECHDLQGVFWAEHGM